MQLPLKISSKLPPSELGFVCRPDMPPHINILFRARPPLPFIPLKPRDIHRNYTGVLDNDSYDILSLFEKKAPPKPEIKEPKYITRMKDLVQRLDRQKELNKEKIKECIILINRT
ncbi:MAG: hypothetical protein MJ252_14975 [archaeon]|nr:hypothetical protein [archaeon]